MKKTLFIVVLLLSASCISAQGYEVYNCGVTTVRTRLDDTWSDYTYNKDINMLIRVCIKENKVEFNNNTSTTFYIINTIDFKSGIDNDGDEYNRYIYSGYDKRGLKCTLISIDWIKLPNRNFILQYSDAEIGFECKMIVDNVI